MAGVATMPSGLVRPAIAQGAPEIRWRCTSSFPPELDTIYGGAEIFAEAVAAMTDGRFRIDVRPPGEIVPALQAADAVAAGTVDLCHTASYYYTGRDPTFALATAVPFGLNSRMQNAWLFQGGANELFNDFFAKYNLYGLPAGSTGCQMGGWFRKEINTVDDLKGLTFRIGGFAGRVLERVGVVPVQIAGNEIYLALEKGTIDAAEWIGPYDDEKLGFVRIAPFYYYPGFWEAGTTLHVLFNRERWNELPEYYRAVCYNAAAMTTLWMQARYDALNPAALRTLAAQGMKLRKFPHEVLVACLKAADLVYAETSAQNDDFKKLYEHMAAFRKEQYLWWQVAEYAFNNFMVVEQGAL